MTNSGGTQPSFWQVVRNAALPMLVTLVIVVVLGIQASMSFRPLSIIDEFQHLDMTARASQGSLLVPAGAQFEQESMTIAACRGETFEADWPACGLTQYEPEEFGDFGVNTAAGRVSVYYLPTAVSGRAIDAAFDRWDFLDAARIANVLALAVGAALVSLLSYALSRSRALALSLGLLVGLVPPMLVQGASVNPDSWSLLAGALVTALALARTRMRTVYYTALMTGGMLLAASVKPNFVVLASIPVVFAVADVIAARQAGASWKGAARALVPGAVAAAAAGAAFLASTLLPRLFAVPNSPDNPAPYLEISANNPWDSWDKFGELVQAPFPFTSFFSPSVALGSTPMAMLAILIGLVIMAPTIAAMSTGVRASRQFVLATAALTGLALSALLVIVGQLLVGQSFDYPQRYGLVMLPTIAAVAAATPLRRAWPYAVTAGIAVISIAAALWDFPTFVAN